jgi:hypothetical protein
MNIAHTAAVPIANLNEKIRVSLLRLGAINGGLRDLAEKARVPYSTLWNQINRQHGILAAVIPPIVSATGDQTLLSMLADACGFIVAPKPRYLRTRREIRRQETGLAIAVGQALDVIERALTDGLINSLERERIQQALSRVCANSLEIGQTIEKGRFLRKRSR